jgi:hypothetical protein
VNVGDRPIGRVDHSQGRGVGLDEEQRGVRIVSSIANSLSQRGRGQKSRDQHDVLDLVGNQRITQHRGLDVIAPRHPRRNQLVAAFCGAFPSPQDGRKHLAGCGGGRRVLGDVEVVLVDRDPVGAFTFDQHHADLRWRYRNAKYDAHHRSSSPG